MDYLYEQFEHVSGKTILQHPFIGYDPAQSGRKLRGASTDLESQRKGLTNNSNGLTCFICQQSKDKHATAEDMKLHRADSQSNED